MPAYKQRFAFLIILFLTSLSSLAQNREADSLRLLLSATTADTMKVFLMYKISDAYSLTELPIAKKYADSALQLAQTIGYKKGMARSYTRLGNIFNATGEFDTSLAEHLISLKLCEEMKDETGIAAAYNNIALMYTTRNLTDDYKNAIDNFKKAKDSYERLKDSTKLTTVLLNIGDGYEKMNMLDSAFIYTSRAKVIALKQEDYESLGAIYINLAFISYKSGKIEDALKDLRSGVNYMSEIEDNYSLATAWYTLSLCFKKLNKIDSFEYYAKRAIQFGDSTSNYATVLDAANELSKHYAAVGNYSSYYQYKEMASTKDSIINNKKSVARVEQLKLQEVIRQEGIKAKEEEQAKARIHTVQKVVIAGFIVTLFVALLALKRRKAHPKAIKALSFICLLLVFEFITFIVHPYIDKLTHHEPIYMVLILALFAGLLGRLHHKTEHWLIERLIHKGHHEPGSDSHSSSADPIEKSHEDLVDHKTIEKAKDLHKDKQQLRSDAKDHTLTDAANRLHKRAASNKK